MRRTTVIKSALALAVVVGGCSSDAARRDGPGMLSVDASADGFAIDVAADATGDADTAADAAPTRRICDGSDGIRLAYSIPVQPMRVLAFTAELYDVGTSFLYVDGHCHYWVQQANPTDR